MAKNDFKAFATDRNANVMSQEEWEALPALISGFTAGKASSAQVNKVIRQASFIAAALAQFVSDKTQRDVLDNGDLPGFVELLGSGFAVEYLSRKNPFGDIKSDGTVQTALENLGLPELLNLKRDKTDNRFSTFVFESGRPEDSLWLAYDEQKKQFAIAFKVDGAAKYVYLQNKGGSLALEEQVTAQAILTKLLQVDGSGSGLDADLVRGLPADFGSSPSTNGYQKLPSGMIIQWGLSEITPTDVYVKFPVAFTRPPLFVGESSPGGGQTTSVWTANAITNVGFNATQICVLSNTSDRVLLPDNNATTWLAIGF